jgi:hypothetical protein
VCWASRQEVDRSRTPYTTGSVRLLGRRAREASEDCVASGGCAGPRNLDGSIWVRRGIGCRLVRPGCSRPGQSSRHRPPLSDRPLNSAYRDASRDGDTSADRDAARGALGRSRGGPTTKVHLLADAGCRPLMHATTAGQRHDSLAFAPLLQRLKARRRGSGRPRTRPRALRARRCGPSGFGVPGELWPLSRAVSRGWEGMSQPTGPLRRRCPEHAAGACHGDLRGRR